MELKIPSLAEPSHTHLQLLELFDNPDDASRV